MDNELQHYGTPRRSGRYPWGSGGEPYQRALDWRKHIKELKDKGLTDNEIASFEGIKTTQLRARMSLTKNDQYIGDRNRALNLKDKGYSNVEIGRLMGKNESSIRNLLNPVLAERAEIATTTANVLKANVDSKRYIDVGTGIETNIGVRRTQLNNAIGILQEQGYKVYTVNVPQVGSPGQFTKFKVLGKPDTEWKELVKDPGLIQFVNNKSDDYGRTFTSDLGLKPIQHLSLDRVKVRYAEDGGGDKDGVIELRRGVKDLDLGNAKYAQVRIGVNGTHFLKGMAIYSDDMPNDCDVVFNTNKKNTGNKLDAMKKLKSDPDNPFGATLKRDVDEFGQIVSVQRGAINVVNEEGDWSKWSKTISSQVLSKQTVPLAKTQLGLSYKQKQEEYEEIMSLTNPVVKKQLLLSFADDCDSSSVHLKAAGLPRQANKIILPIPDLKENQCYAPSFNDGEQVVLIRHPHAGPFEIPQLTVNNKSKAAKAAMENATDAIGIHPNVAKKLSGADFDGDTVIVIPNNSGKIKTASSLKGLKDFDPIERYAPYDGMTTIDGGTYRAKTHDVDYGGKKPKTQIKQTKMGEVSNLISDMNIKGASPDELARAVKHSMVVIDSEKHMLNYKLSAQENGIKQLSAKYQNGNRGGASTLISKASSELRVNERKPRSSAEGGPIDPVSGKKVYTPTNAQYINKKGKVVIKTTLTTKMAETDDAKSLSSGRAIEVVYADYANSLKALANTSRKNALSIIPSTKNPSAEKVYSKEVASLNSSLALANLNRPLERKAQVLANSVITRKKEANPYLEKDELKKIKNQAMAQARVTVGAKKPFIEISTKEWEAIQAGAISPSKLSAILHNADLDRVKALATPRTKLTMTTAKKNLARNYLNNGYTIAEVAEQLGVSTATLSASLVE